MADHAAAIIIQRNCHSNTDELTEEEEEEADRASERAPSEVGCLDKGRSQAQCPKKPFHKSLSVLRLSREKYTQC